MSDRLFDVDDVPEVPLVRPPRRSRGEHDARFRNDYPNEWGRCPDCNGRGWLLRHPNGTLDASGYPMNDTLRRELVANTLNAPMVARGYGRGICRRCLGMGSVKRKVRLLAGFRCERCLHPYLGKGDMKQLGKVGLASNHQWSRCDERCTHAGPWRMTGDTDFKFIVNDPRVRSQAQALTAARSLGADLSTWDEALRFGVEAEWRILTVHHLDGDKANLAWWNLACLCQRCHLEVQAKVVMEQAYPHEHSGWFKPHAAGYYAAVYLGEDVTREEAVARMDELLALELAA